MITLSLTTTDLAIACIGLGILYALILAGADSDRKRRKAIPRFMRQRDR